MNTYSHDWSGERNRTIEAEINKLTSDELRQYRVAMNAHDDNETREALIAYLLDGGALSDLTQ